MSIFPFRPLDPFVATLAATVGFACLSLFADPSAAVAVELLVLGVAVAAAYAQRRVVPLWLTLGGVSAYLLLELGRGRLGFDHYWQHIAAVFLLGAAVVGAAGARVAREDLRAALSRTADEAGRLRAENELDALLGGGRARDPVEQELLRSRRHDHAAGLLLIRPDEGDEDSLRAVAAALGRLLRTSDVALRHGARDLCVLLPETEPAGARAAGERLRLALLAAGTPTVSIGAASFPDTDLREGLLLRASEALERARTLGGNRTVASFLPPTAPSAWRLDGEPPLTRTSDSTST